jgi:hypothetical protein
MKDKIFAIFNKLKPKQLIILIIVLLLGIWMIVNLVFKITLSLPGGNVIQCGSEPADIKVNYDNK